MEPASRCNLKQRGVPDTIKTLLRADRERVREYPGRLKIAS